ncbi:MAG: zinc-ribbon domain-containing protein [Oscillospiraceae bacterium]|nr:zinc-ribbon domain-containing protein [Oscillospiraceae bacterium]
MNIKERVAYLEGLAEGMNIKDVEHGKFFTALVDTLRDMADEIDELSENAFDLGEEIDVLSNDLSDVEEFLLDDDYDFDDDDFDFDFDDDDDYEYEHEGCPKEGGFCCDFNAGEDHHDTEEDDDDIEFTINIRCPECNAEIEIDEEDVANEAVTCKSCNNEIELEIDEVDVDDDHAEG